MTVTTDALIPALEDARKAHTGVIDRFRSDLTTTPSGHDRQSLERHVADVEGHIAGIDKHLRELRPRRMLRDAAQTAGSVAADAVRQVRLPLEIGAVIAGGILLGERRTSRQHRLHSAQEEYAAAARALAACRAAESIAALALDEDAGCLLAALRRTDEELLRALEYSVDEQARAVAAAAADGGRPYRGDGGLAGAATRGLRTAVDRLLEAVQAGGEQVARTAAGTAPQAPDARWMAEQVQGAVTREEELPIPGYGVLTVSDITQRLRLLSQTDLTIIEGYERAHANRDGVLTAVERLRGSRPWPDYDALSPGEITRRLRTADPVLARQILDYEQRHRQRPQITAAAQQHLATI